MEFHFDPNSFPDPADYPDIIAAIPHIVVGCDLSGIESFRELFELAFNANLDLWQIQYGIDDDGQPYPLNHKLMSKPNWWKK